MLKLLLAYLMKKYPDDVERLCPPIAIEVDNRVTMFAVAGPESRHMALVSELRRAGVEVLHPRAAPEVSYADILKGR